VIVELMIPQVQILIKRLDLHLVILLVYYEILDNTFTTFFLIGINYIQLNSIIKLIYVNLISKINRQHLWALNYIQRKCESTSIYLHFMLIGSIMIIHKKRRGHLDSQIIMQIQKTCPKTKVS